MTIALALLRRYWLHALVAAVLVWGAQRAHDYIWQNGYNAANVRAERIIADFAKAEAAAQERARQAEQATARAIAEADARHQQEIADAQANAARLAADLRAGNVRLRGHWAGCETDRVSGDAERARIADEAARLRAESASRVVQAADEADAQVRGLQRVIESGRND